MISRCQIERLKYQIPNPKLKIQKDKKNESVLNPLEIRINQIVQMDLGERFKLAEELTKKLDKDETLEAVRQRVEEWLAEIIAELHHGLLADTTPEQNAKNLKTLLATQKQLRQNLNLRLVLENCLMDLA